MDVSDAMVKVALEWIEKNYGAEVRAAVEETDTDPVRFRNGAVAYRKRFKSKISSTESTGAEVFGNISPGTVQVQYEHMTAEVSDSEEDS